jgi:hypothetical protein
VGNANLVRKTVYFLNINARFCNEGGSCMSDELQVALNELKSQAWAMAQLCGQ